MGSISATAEFTLPTKYPTDRRGPARWITSHAIRQWRYILLALFGAFGNAALAAVAPIIIGMAFTDILQTPPQTARLALFAGIIAISQISRGILQFGRNFSFEIIAQRTERNIRDEMYIALLGKSMTFHSLQSVGDTMARASNDVREINFLFSPGMNLVVGALNFLFLPLFLSLRYHPTLILVPALFIIIFFLLLRQYLQTLRPVTEEVRATFGQLNSRLSEALDGIETVKGGTQETAEVEQFHKNVILYRNAAVRQGDIEGRFLPLLLFVVTLSAGLLHALILFKLGLLDVGQVISYFGILLLLDFPVFSSLFAYSQISLGLAGARRILELMNKENNLDQNDAGFNGPMQGRIEFKDVFFAYEESDPVLENISVNIKQGQTVALVGETGSGKTSFVKLVNRTYDTTSGVVLIDGMDVREWNLDALRKNISIIEQDVFLFSRTVAENIAFGKPDATSAEIELAARASQAHDFISALSEGYQTVLGERGVNLSGGQRQRLALARAFLTNPCILILDDSTSAIDSATEDQIQRAIYAAAKGRTTLIITHRLSQIRWADQIIVFRKGRVVAIGKHEDLLNSSEAYQKIFSE
jgi:ATP-binding cassette subfamily B protein